jgi:uncharacterized protein (TIGR03437 family)
MLKILSALLYLSSVVSAQNAQLTITSAASVSAGLAAESLATAFGTNLALETTTAQSTPWPTALGGVVVQITDSAGIMRPAGLIYVSPHQINFQIPAGIATGTATVSVNNNFGNSATVQIQALAPALFSVNDQGVAAATAVAVAIPTPAQFPVPVFQCVDTPDSCQLVPIDPGLDRPVFLSFYGTGIRGRSSLSNVTVTIGTMTVGALYAGPQPQIPGLDQVNVPLPLSLRGAGEVNVIVTVDGIASNPVKIKVR